MSSDYSETWFRTFLETYPADQTAREIKLIEKWLPLPNFPKLLDVCCGEGRHSSLLAQHGYAVTGIDINEQALRKARLRSGTGVNYIHADMRDIEELPEPFDAAMIMWGSFGYFDDTTNEDVLRAVAAKLRKGGRFIAEPV